jgi:hypothetical protein
VPMHIGSAIRELDPEHVSRPCGCSRK